jgi:Ca-activated chloride channel family protein
MRLPNRTTLIFLAVASATSSTGAAFAQGTVVIDRPVPDPRRPGRVTTMPLQLKYQRVDTEITDGVAVTEITQSFLNPLGTAIEGTYVFPLPEGVAVGDFEMTVAGRTLKGEVLEKDQARRTYEAIVRRTQDPGLLEFLGKRLYQASVFPIPPGDKLDIKLSYSQTLSEHGGLGEYTHPLASHGRTTGPVDEITVRVKVKSSLPLMSVFCPSHGCDVQRPNDHEATLVYEATGVTPDRDFSLFYQRKDAQFGMSVLTHRPVGEQGYFLMRLSPRVEVAETEILPKDIAFVVDTSGSMQGEKIEQLRRSLKFCVGALRDGDRFNIYRFSTQVQPFRDSLAPATKEIRDEAIDFCNQLEAVGGTNINRALLETLDDDPRDESRPYLIVFMTDGEPTVDVTNPAEILKNVGKANARDVRFHVLGIGTDVNTHLLDQLAETNRGSREYVTETDDLEIKMGALTARLNNPALTDIRLEMADLAAADVYPSTIPDLFHGDDIVVLGRFDSAGHHAIRLVGKRGDEQQTLVYEGEFPTVQKANDFLPRLWANRKVAYLLDQIRLHGGRRELVDEVIRLATRHGIVTPYTSALILEDERQLALGRPMQREEANALQALGYAGGSDDEVDDRPAPGPSGTGGMGLRPGGGGSRRATAGRAPGRSSGKIAADASNQLRDQAEADSLDQEKKGESERLNLHRAGDKTFRLVDGKYVDTAWEKSLTPTRIEAFSDAYFELIAKHPEVAEYLTLGDRVLFVIDGAAYEVAPKE